MKKLLIILMMGMMLLTLVSAETSSLGNIEQGSCIDLYQTCDDCSYVNLTSIKYPNGTIETFNLAMTKVNQDFSYNFCNTTQVGDYSYTVAGDKGGVFSTEVIEFSVNKLELPTMLLYFFSLGLLIGLFILTLLAIPKLPSEDNYDDEGILISINQLKYMRPVLYMVGWMILIAIVFTGSNMAIAFLGTNLLGNILFTIFQIMFALTLPGVVLWFIFIFYNIFQDKKMKGYIERGMEFGGN